MATLVDYPTSTCINDLLFVKQYFSQKDFTLELIENIG